MTQGLFLDLDGAWGDEARDGVLSGIPRLDARSFGPRLRYHARSKDIAALSNQLDATPSRLILYGSGDFHHLAGLFVQRAASTGTVLVSFDNHPDWDIRPPRWSCGGWLSRALRSKGVERASVWGCGNFELKFPSRLFANHLALKNGRLEVHGWAERLSRSVQRRFPCITRDNWRERFEHFALGLAGRNVYVTVDLDCLNSAEAVTNWEQGLFTAADVAWAIGQIRDRSNLIGGDVCGAYSPPVYARRLQRLAGNWDHPPLPKPNSADAIGINTTALAVIWPALS